MLLRCKYELSLNTHTSTLTQRIAIECQKNNIGYRRRLGEFPNQNVEHCMTSIRVSTRCISLKRKVRKSTDTRC